MRISDWSSDVCSSDLSSVTFLRGPLGGGLGLGVLDGLPDVLADVRLEVVVGDGDDFVGLDDGLRAEPRHEARLVGGKLGRASCRERAGQYGEIWGASLKLKKQKTQIIKEYNEK